MGRPRRRDRDGVRRRDDRGGRYEIQWSTKDPETGGHVRHRKLLDTRSAQAAQLERAKVLRRAQEGGRAEPVKGVTLRHLEEDYLDACELQKGILTKKQRVRRILGKIGDVPLEQLTPQDLRDFMASIIGDAPEDRIPHKQKTANRYFATVKAMIRWGVEEELVPEHVLLRLRKVKPFKESAGRIHFFYLNDVAKLMAKCREPELCEGYMVPLVLLGLGTGIRRGDLLKLRWRDVDMRSRKIYVGGSAGGDTKGGASYLVDMGGIARLGIAEASAWLEAKGMPAEPDDFVIDWRSRDRVEFLAKREYPEVRKAAELDPTLLFAALRHTFATWALARGESLPNVQYWMGHASIATTQRYLHYIPRDKQLQNTLNPLSDKSGQALVRACNALAKGKGKGRAVLAAVSPVKAVRAVQAVPPKSSRSSSSAS